VFGTVPKARPSVTPWNKRNGALKIIFQIASDDAMMSARAPT
jgi:hypothetical protein